LPSDLPADAPADSRFPALGGVGSSTPITSASLGTGLALNWSAWAEANPDLRLANARAVIHQTGVLTVRDVPVMPGTTQLTLPAITGKAGVAVQESELWLTALDTDGRLLMTRYRLQP